MFLRSFQVVGSAGLFGLVAGSDIWLGVGVRLFGCLGVWVGSVGLFVWLGVGVRFFGWAVGSGYLGWAVGLGSLVWRWGRDIWSVIGVGLFVLFVRCFGGVGRFIFLVGR